MKTIVVTLDKEHPDGEAILNFTILALTIMNNT